MLIELILNCEIVAEVIDVWTNASYGMLTDYLSWAANSTDLGGAEFVYVG